MQLAQEERLKLEALSHRFYMDTPFPFINMRLVREYIQRMGNLVDVVVEPYRFDVVFKSPRMICYALVGYLLPTKGNMTVVFRT